MKKTRLQKSHATVPLKGMIASSLYLPYSLYGSDPTLHNPRLQHFDRFLVVLIPRYPPLVFCHNLWQNMGGMGHGVAPTGS